jgi:hypothetical protein
MQLASNDRSCLEGTPIDMAPERFDRQRAPERGHRRARARRDLSSRTPRSRCRGTLRKPSSPAARVGPRIGACPIGSLRSFAACGRQTAPLAPSCRTLELDAQHADSDGVDGRFDAANKGQPGCDKAAGSCGCTRLAAGEHGVEDAKKRTLRADLLDEVIFAGLEIHLSSLSSSPSDYDDSFDGSSGASPRNA